jgi:hypothetical protein
VSGSFYSVLTFIWRSILYRCDRILWYGKGLRQLEYKHIESWLSDHRPVSSTFMAEVEIASHGKLKPTFCKNSKVEAEELRLTTLIPVLWGKRTLISAQLKTLASNVSCCHFLH